MRGRRAGFGLGEALVLVVIVAGLAGVSRGVHRPSPEDTCLANVKTICAAIRMYASDNADRLPPKETDERVVAYLKAQWGREGREPQMRRDPLTSGGPVTHGHPVRCRMLQEANPYLKWPVVLDGYLPNRQVWSCPSARVAEPASFIIGPKDWMGHLQANSEGWGTATSLCLKRVFPSGWGGAVTDSLTQGRMAGPEYAAGNEWLEWKERQDPKAPPGVFTQSIGTNRKLAGLRVNECPDPDRFVLAADAGVKTELMLTGTLAYPDLCALECANPQCGWADWDKCTWAADCGLYRHAPNDGSFVRDPEVRKPYARHRGGVNIGFVDGHAQWFDSEEVLRRSFDPDATDALLGYQWAMGMVCGCGEENGPMTLFASVAKRCGYEVPEAEADEDDADEPGDGDAPPARWMPDGV